ncbi:bifunctional nuclease family protein [bacterium]|nr:bifunctional nuclease family protein [bacterium]
MAMMIEMEMVEIQLHDNGGQQIIILQEKDGARIVSIFVGTFEFIYLDQALKGIIHERPMTHDLIVNVLDTLGGKLVGVLVDELRNNTYFGKLLVRTGDGEVLRVDSRPSDAMVLAMKERVPIYVEEDVLRAVSGEEEERESDDDE